VGKVARFWRLAPPTPVVITALRDESGVLRVFGKVTRDISERRRAEEEIRKLSLDLQGRSDAFPRFDVSI
jgi:hypothetical protein